MRLRIMAKQWAWYIGIVCALLSILCIRLATQADFLLIGDGNESELTVGFDEGWLFIENSENASIPTAPPTIINTYPVSGYRGSLIVVTITGSDFDNTSAVDFGADIVVDNFTVDNSTQITAGIDIADTAAYGDRDIQVTTPGGSDNLTDGFEVLVGTISSVTPNYGYPGDIRIAVTIIGTHFDNTTVVDFGADVIVSSFSLDSAIQISANVSVLNTATDGWRTVIVTTDYDTIAKSNGFEVRDSDVTWANEHPDLYILLVILTIVCVATGLLTILYLGFSGKSPSLLVGTGVGTLVLTVVMMTLLYLLAD